MAKLKIAIIGATGYTGSELVRLLINHPDAEIEVITSESRAGEKFSDVHPFFQGIADNKLVKSEEIDKYDPDVAFLALPHGVSMDFVKKFRNKPFKIIDLSGDFRLSSPDVYKKWYDMEHVFPEGFERAAFGLPELYADKIKDSNLVANPGCYPTSAILGAAPLLDKKLVDTAPIIIDSKSGVTGAGVKPKLATHFPNVNDNFKAYKLKNHRHSIEIQENFDALTGKNAKVQFTPHLLPVDRGILSTIYTRAVTDIDQKALDKAYQAFYMDAPFVRLRKQPPAIKDVRGTNYCDIYSTYDERTGLIITVSAIDNLVKGAAGQAIQNMNLMFGIDESSGLKLAPVNP